MRRPADITALVRRRLERTWHLDVASAESSWPHTVPLGSSASGQIAADFSATRERIEELRTWAGANGVIVTDVSRRVHGTMQPIPTRVTVPSLDVAAALAGEEWVARVHRARRRADVLATRYPHCVDVAKVVRLVDGLGDVDFQLLQKVADWFAVNTASGLTPRQVPIPGVHAKWLNTGRRAVELLVDRTLDLSQRHPPRIHFTYLDPQHLALGRRRFDSATVGDAVEVAYKPEIVLIAENKDTAIHFPATRLAIAVEGDGFGGATAAEIDWIISAQHVVYWGD